MSSVHTMTDHLERCIQCQQPVWTRVTRISRTGEATFCDTWVEHDCLARRTPIVWGNVFTMQRRRW